MDPNETLRQIDEFLNSNREGEVVDQWCESLFEWLQKGGFEPDWRKYRTGAEYYRCRAYTQQQTGAYLQLRRKPTALELKLTAAGKRKVKEEIAEGRPEIEIIPELLEDHLADDWSLLRPEELGALTSCPWILGWDAVYDDAGRLQKVAEVYWHERYQIENLAEELLRGPVLLPRVPLTERIGP